MIVYKNTTQGFIKDVLDNKIDDAIHVAYQCKIGRSIAQNERRAWTNSMGFMERVIRKANIADDCGILIEYVIPATSSRIDFLIAGLDQNNGKKFIIIELKQWEEAESTHKDSIVTSVVNRSPKELPHPSYQAYSYKMFMKDFNEAIYNGNIGSYSCAYLHNYREKDPEPLKAPIYREIIKDTPLYFKTDSEKLAEFIRNHVGKGKGEKIVYEIESGKIRPSKKLIDHVCAMFKGHQTFVLIDEQKVAYEKAMDVALHSKQKTVLIIKGGPGTGKSVISMNLLAGILSNEQNVCFVAPNASFRDVMVQSLARTNSLSRLKHLFKGSAGFHDVDENIYDVLVVDEAHRLKNGSAYQYRGDNQVEDIIRAAMVSIFFVDDNQKIRPEDIGSVAELKRIAEMNGAKTEEIELVAQFRCAGADGYINWLDDIFHIRHTGNYDGWNTKEFEFKIVDNPHDVYRYIKGKSDEGFKSRLLAGYAWPWTSGKEGNSDADVNDVSIPEFNFAMPWNSRKVGTTWAIDEDGIEQVGCIHTSQGLDFDYVGVIVGNDLRYDAKTETFYVDWNNYKDVNGKKGLRDKPEILSKLVCNIYKTLMSRPMRGCVVYFCDKEVEAYFKRNMAFYDQQTKIAEEEALGGIEDSVDESLRFNEYLPVFSLRAAAGKFGDGEAVQETGWMRIAGAGRLREGMFVAQINGHSMEPLIPDKSYAIFRSPVEGTRQGKIVLVQSNKLYDPETGGSYTVKRYSSEKKYSQDETWAHSKILLSSINPEYPNIEIKETEEGECKVVAEFVKVI